MPKYYLQCPQCKKQSLREKGQLGSKPVSRCGRCNTFWLLVWGKDFKRLLVKFDPTTSVIDRAVLAAVPDDWTGEPEAIGVDQDTWWAMTQPNAPYNAVAALDVVRQHIVDGDYVYLIDSANHICARLVLQDEQFVQIPVNG